MSKFEWEPDDVKIIRKPKPSQGSKAMQAAMQAEKQHTGAMLALYPDTPPEFSLADSDLTPTAPDELHVTMAYLGDAADLDEEDRAFLRRVCEQIASEFEPIQAKLGGIGRFLNLEDDDTQAYYASVDSPDIEKLRARLVEVLGALGLLPDSDHGFTPHMTLAYVPIGKPAAGAGLQEEPVEFGKLSLSLGGEREDFPFSREGEKYSPGQARDSSGRFAGGASSGHQMARHEQLTETDSAKLKNEVKNWGGQRTEIGNFAVAMGEGSDPEPVLTYSQGGKMVGIASVTKLPEPKAGFPPGKYVEVIALATSEKGHGERIMHDIAGQAAKSNAGLVLNATAYSRGFYEKLGLHQVPNTNHFYLSESETKDFAKGKKALEDEPDDGVFVIPLETRKRKARAKQNILLTYPDESKPHRFVWQQHFRGKSSHGDFRVESGDYLVGWTIPDQIPGAIAEPVETLAQATTAVNNPDLWKMDLKTGEIKPRQIRGGTVRKGDLRALPKGVEIPADWLNEQGVTDKPDPGEAIPVGATRNYPGVFKIVDKGTVEAGARKPWFWEVWIHGEKWGTQRWVFRLLERSKEVNHALQAEGWEEEAEEVKQDTLPPGVIEQNPRSETYWIFLQPGADTPPYVLSPEAIDKDWLPPKGVSALPKMIKSRVPPALRYWEVSGQDALDRRAKLAEMDVRELGGSSAKQLGPWQPYRLQYRFFRGPIQVRFGASTKFHDLWLDDGTHYVIDGDPLTNDRLAAYQEHDKPTVSTADGKRVSVLRIGSEPIELAPGQPANPTKDTPAFVQTVDEGEARVLDSQPEFTKLEFKGGKLKGAWYFRLESADSKIGEFGKSEGPQVSAKFAAGQPRDSSGRWTSWGGSMVGALHGTDNEHITMAQNSMDNLPDWARSGVKRVDLRPEPGKGFKAGDKHFETGAEWSKRRKMVTVYNANSTSQKEFDRMISHEAGHSAYDDLIDGSRSGSAAHQEAYGNFRKAWDTEDGITPYSKAWAKSGEASETFAEMAKIHLTQGMGELESVCYRGKATNLLKAYKQSISALKAGKKSLDEDEKAASRKIRKFFDDDWNEVKPEKATQAVELEFGSDGQVLSSVTYALAHTGEKGVRPLFGSPGGKRLLAKTIVDLIPEHKVYVEPFAGGAAVLFAKPPEMSEKEVLADADPDIAFAYRTVKGLSDAEIAELAGMDWEASETKWKSLKDSTPSSKAGKLHKFLYLNAYSKRDRRSYRHWYDGDETSVTDRMPLVRDRMKSVKVLNQDYREVLKAYDSPNTFFYLDPPYPDTGNLSEWNFDADAFEKTLKGLKGKVLVSWSPRSPKLDLKGWSQRSVKLQRSDQDRSEDTELLIANYPLPKRVRRKSMDEIEALQLVYTCSGCKGEFESETVLGNPLCPGCADKALTWRPYLLQRHNDHHDLRIGDDFTLRLSGTLLDNEPDQAEVSTESPTLQGADGQAVDARKVKPGDPVKLSDGEIETLDKGQARYAKVQQGHQVEFKGGKLDGVYLFGPQGAHPIDDLEHIDVEWEPGQPEPEPAEPEGDGHPPLFPFEPPPMINPDLIHPFNPPPPSIPGALPPPGVWHMGDGEVAIGWKLAPPSTAEKDVVELEEKDKSSVDEGTKVGKRIKTEKLSKLEELYQSLADAVKWLGDVIKWGKHDDTAPEPSMLDFFKGSDAGFTVKTVRGEPWLFTWSANAFKDREGEIFSTKALESWADRASERDDKGTYNFWHIPGSDFAVKKWVGVPGRFLVEAGPFTKDAKGKAAQAFFAAYPDRHPTLAPEGWGCSVEYRYLPEERKKGVYNNVEITRTSVLPRFAAANTWTAVKEVTMALTDAQKKAAQELFGEDLAASILGEAEAKTKELEPNVAHKGEGEQTEPDAPVPPEAEQVAPESEDDKAKKKDEKVPPEDEPYPKPTKAEKKQLDQFVKAIRDVAASVTDDSPGRTAILEVADKLSEENLKDMAAELKKAGKAVKNAAQKARLTKLVEAMAGDGTYPAPGEDETYPAPTKSKEFVEAVAAELAKQFKLDTQPIGEALTATAAALKGLEDRITALETQSGRKAATDLPRFVFGLVEQASKASSTEVPEGDALLQMRPKETTIPVQDGSMAAHFFVKPK